MPQKQEQYYCLKCEMNVEDPCFIKEIEHTFIALGFCPICGSELVKRTIIDEESKYKKSTFKRRKSNGC